MGCVCLREINVPVQFCCLPASDFLMSVWVCAWLMSFLKTSIFWRKKKKKTLTVLFLLPHTPHSVNILCCYGCQSKTPTFSKIHKIFLFMFRPTKSVPYLNFLCLDNAKAFVIQSEIWQVACTCSVFVLVWLIFMQTARRCREIYVIQGKIYT